MILQQHQNVTDNDTPKQPKILTSKTGSGTLSLSNLCQRLKIDKKIGNIFMAMLEV